MCRRRVHHYRWKWWWKRTSYTDNLLSPVNSHVYYFPFSRARKFGDKAQSPGIIRGIFCWRQVIVFVAVRCFLTKFGEKRFWQILKGRCPLPVPQWLISTFSCYFYHSYCMHFCTYFVVSGRYGLHGIHSPERHANSMGDRQLSDNPKP